MKTIIEETEQVQDATEIPTPIKEEITDANSESTIVPNQTVLSGTMVDSEFASVISSSIGVVPVPCTMKSQFSTYFSFRC